MESEGVYRLLLTHLFRLLKIDEAVRLLDAGDLVLNTLRELLFRNAQLGGKCLPFVHMRLCAECICLQLIDFSSLDAMIFKYSTDSTWIVWSVRRASRSCCCISSYRACTSLQRDRYTINSSFNDSMMR